MVTNESILRGVNMYPIPPAALQGIAARRGIDLSAEVSADSFVPASALMLAKADVLMWLSGAPNISQGGQSYSFSGDQRQQFILDARTIYGVAGEATDDGSVTTVFGYKGGRL